MYVPQPIPYQGSRRDVAKVILAFFPKTVETLFDYEVAGEPKSKERKVEDYMLLCASCNRAKSWSCENCDNWKLHKNPQICATCY